MGEGVVLEDLKQNFKRGQDPSTSSHSTPLYAFLTLHVIHSSTLIFNTLNASAYMSSKS
jgi:hypothetical protein